MDEIEPLEEALQFAGWLLANQAYSAVDAGSANPLAMVASDELESPRLVEFRDDHKSYAQMAITGKNLITDQGKGHRAWAYVYDQDLGPAGRMILMELGCRRLGVSLAVGQRYAPGSNESDFTFVGDLQVLRRELLPLPVLQTLEDIRWRDLMADGAMSHPSGEARWTNLRSKIAPEQMSCTAGDFHFISPGGWLGQPGSDEGSWFFFRPCPCGEEDESSLLVSFLAWKGNPPLEVVAERMRQTELKLGHPVLESEITAFLPLGVMIGRLLWEEPEKSLRRQAVLFPTGEPGHFLFLQVQSSPASWEEAQCAMNEVLATLDRAHGKLKSFWKKWAKQVLPK